MQAMVKEMEAELSMATIGDNEGNKKELKFQRELQHSQPDGKRVRSTSILRLSTPRKGFEG
jgi:hypothetical protein